MRNHRPGSAGADAFRCSLVVTAGLLTALTAAPCRAEIEEVIVTARKVEENLQQVPLSVSAITSEALAQRGVQSLADLNASVPNLGWQPPPNGGNSSSAFFIRGIGQFDYIATSDPSVGMYVDGVFIARSVGSLLNVVDIDRVEVLRGPQGTLFGRNTPAGAVQIVTTKPKKGVVAGEVSLTGGRYDRLDLKASVDLPLGSNAAVKLTAATLNQDGLGTALVSGNDLATMDDQVFRANLLWDPTDALSINLIADYTKREANSSTFKVVSINDADPFINLYNVMLVSQGFDPITAANFVDSSRYDSWKGVRNIDDNEVKGLTATVDWTRSDAFALKSITAYRSMDNETTEDFDGTPYPFVDQETPTGSDQFSQEFQLSGRAFDQRLRWIGGLFYFREQVDQTVDGQLFGGITRTGPGRFDFVFDPNVDGLPAPFPPFSFVNNLYQSMVMDQTTESWAVFGEGTWAFSPQWSLTAGLRYSVDDKELTQSVQPFRGPVTVSDDWGAFTPRVVLNWQRTDDLLLYASASRGFRSGGFNGRETGPSPTPYDPEYVWSYELGMKSDLLDRRLRVNTAAFYYDYSDKQGVVLKPDQTIAVGNVGTVELYGLELEVTAAPSDQLRFELGLGLLHQEITEIRTSGGIPGLRSDSQLENSPKLTANFGAQYSVPLDTYGTLTLRGDVTYKAEHYFLLPNYPTERQGGYGLVNARLGWQSPARTWSIEAYGKNIFDREYSLFRESTIGFGYDMVLANFGRPAEYGVEARYRF